jgi:hypothetical protein
MGEPNCTPHLSLPLPTSIPPPSSHVPNNKRNRNTYIVPTLAFLKRQNEREDEIREYSGCGLSVPGSRGKVTQTAEGGQGGGIQMQLNASHVAAQEGPSFLNTAPERGPREQSMLEAPPR